MLGAIRELIWENMLTSVLLLVSFTAVLLVGVQLWRNRGRRRDYWERERQRKEFWGWS